MPDTYALGQGSYGISNRSKTRNPPKNASCRPWSEAILNHSDRKQQSTPPNSMPTSNSNFDNKPSELYACPTKTLTPTSKQILPAPNAPSVFFLYTSLQHE